MRAVLFLALATAGLSAATSAPDFNQEVRPILAQRCFKCHGMDDKGRKGELRLDTEDGAFKGGESGPAIVPGKPDQSEAITRIFTTDSDDVMPPASTKVQLTDKEKATLRAWVENGGHYVSHWAYTAPKQAKLPELSDRKDQADSAAANPIDFFILARLQKEKLNPSPEADPYTLVRRLHLDLTGLPPTPEEADAFVTEYRAAPRPRVVYEKLVDHLLADKTYGERWARRWLDLARYADTNGFEKDRPRSIWPYRDWVVDALNADMPFDQFTLKQIAGDMLPHPTPADLIATGFHRNTMLNEEGGIDPNEYRFYAMIDRVSTTCTAWLGLTMNCAQCHTHKYDPIEHAEFYQTMALLNNADEPIWNIASPDIVAQRKAQADKLAKLEAELPTKFPGGNDAMEKRFAAWLAAESQNASHWKVLKPTAMKTNSVHLETQPDGYILGNGDITKSDTYDLSFDTTLKNVRALRIEVASHPSLPNDGPGLTFYEGPTGGFFLSELQFMKNGQRLKVADADETNSDQEVRTNDAAPTIAKGKAKANLAKKASSALATQDGEMSSGWQVLGGQDVHHAAVFVFDKPLDLDAAFAMKMQFERHFACSAGHFRISVTTGDHATALRHPAEIEELLAKPADKLTAAEHGKLLHRFLETAPEMKAQAAQLAALRREPRGQPTLVMRERPASNPRATFRYHRGEYLSPKEQVKPAVPAFLPQLPSGAPADRLAFAKWLVSPANPLTARVVVNRQWQAFFGEGIVRTLADFGYQGDPPSHPELLDWLAVEFVKQGWSLKRLHRLIVTSATYKQSSVVAPEHQQRDPRNIFLARAPRFRLDAEIIRDSALRAAGVLSPKMGGPGVYPPQPASVTTEGTYGKMEWKTSEGEDRFRRSLYTFTKRTAPFAMATTFDAPSGEGCLAKRDVSNSPLQALTMMNDAMFLEVAQKLAADVLKSCPTDDERIVAIFRRCLTRPPAADEMQMLRAFTAKERSRKLSEADLWTAVARAVLNFDEAVTRP